MALNSFCADESLRNYSLTHSAKTYRDHVTAWCYIRGCNIPTQCQFDMYSTFSNIRWAQSSIQRWSPLQTVLK